MTYRQTKVGTLDYSSTGPPIGDGADELEARLGALRDRCLRRDCRIMPPSADPAGTFDLCSCWWRSVSRWPDESYHPALLVAPT